MDNVRNIFFLSSQVDKNDSDVLIILIFYQYFN